MPATVLEAARAEGISPQQVRRDIANGAPAVRRGGPGRGRGSLIDLEAYRCWRTGETADVMGRIAGALVDVLKRDGGEGEPAHVTLGIRRRHAAALLAVAFERIHRAVTGRDADSLPPEIAHAVRGLADLRS